MLDLLLPFLPGFSAGSEAYEAPELLLPIAPRPFFCFPIWSDPFEAETPPVWYGGNWRTGLPVTRVGTDAFDQYARSVDLNASSLVLKCDLKTVRSIGAFVVPYGNYTRGATWRVTIAMSDGALTTSPLYQSAWESVWSIWAPARVPSAFRMPAVHFVRVADELANVNGLRVMIEFSDAANPAGYLQINRAMVTGLLLAPKGIRVGAQDVPVDPSEEILMDGGNAIFNRRPMYRTRKYALGLLEETQAYGALLDMERELGRTRQVFQGWDVDDPFMFERGYTATLTPSGVNWEQPMYQRRELNFKEVV